MSSATDTEKKNDMLHYLEDFHKVAYQLSGVMKVFIFILLTVIDMHFPKKKIITHCYVGLLINHAKDIIASFFWVKKILLIRGEPNHAKNMWRERWSLLHIKCERVRVVNFSLIEVVLIRRSPMAKKWYFSSFNFGETWDRKKKKKGSVALMHMEKYY